MMITRLLATIAIAGTMASSSSIGHITGPRSAEPSIGWDIRLEATITGVLRASIAGGGGMVQQVLFTDTGNYWTGTIEGFFYTSQLALTIQFPSDELNDDLFTLTTPTKYTYGLPVDYDYMGCYINTSLSGMRIILTINDADYIALYSRAVPSGAGFSNGYWDAITSSISAGYFSRVYTIVGTTTYSSVSTYSFPTQQTIQSSGRTTGTPDFSTEAYYIKLLQVNNLEDEEIQQYINQGYGQGFDDGRAQGDQEGYDRGVIEAMDDAGWNDVFAIFSTAIDTVGEVMAISLFGPFTIGALVAIPIVMGLLFWIIDKWRGS
jgi:hypothetical protein